MRLSNNHGIPDTIARAMVKKNAMYNAGKVDTSVTQLIQPPQITVLRKKHFSEMVRDASEEMWALLGSGVHTILELGAAENMVVEERLFLDINGWKISGGIDLQEVDGRFIDVSDYKMTSVWKVMKGDTDPDWVAQLNMYALLIEKNKPEYKVRSLTICAILRDWKGSEAKRDQFYPQAPIVTVDIPVWSARKRDAYALERIRMHRLARFNDATGDALPECSNEERWVKGEKWAVRKETVKKATKIFDTEDEARALVDEKGKGYVIDYRPGQSLRCGYCGVARWCSQYALMAKDNTDERNHPVPDEQSPL